MKKSIVSKVIAVLILIFFGLNTVLPPSYAQVVSQTFYNLPAAGTMIAPTSAFAPVVIRGLMIYPDNPLKFDFVLDRGDEKLSNEEFKSESTRLVKYFLASLTVPEKDMWVNLSPYEKNRIVPDNFGQTEMGRDLLAQDYMLKQLTASLMYPENETGKEFWNRVYTKINERFGMTDIPLNTFNKVWIIPDKASIYEHQKGAFIVKSHLKVMLEEDYVAMSNNSLQSNVYTSKEIQDGQTLTAGKNQNSLTATIQSQVVKEIIIPEIEREVNEGKIFTQLRQIYFSMILASWYKKALKESLLGKIYVDQNKTEGVDIADKNENQKIYEKYVEAFKSSAYEYIKEDYNPETQEVVTRKYISGGVAFASAATTPETDRGEIERAMNVTTGNGDITTIEFRRQDGSSLGINKTASQGQLAEVWADSLQRKLEPLLPTLDKERPVGSPSMDTRVWFDLRDAILTLAGDPSAPGIGRNIMSTIGRPESEEDLVYVAKRMNEMFQARGLPSIWPYLGLITKSYPGGVSVLFDVDKNMLKLAEYGTPYEKAMFLYFRTLKEAVHIRMLGFHAEKDDYKVKHFSDSENFIAHFEMFMKAAAEFKENDPTQWDQVIPTEQGYEGESLNITYGQAVLFGITVMLDPMMHNRKFLFQKSGEEGIVADSLQLLDDMNLKTEAESMDYYTNELLKPFLDGEHQDVINMIADAFMLLKDARVRSILNFRIMAAGEYGSMFEALIGKKEGNLPVESVFAGLLNFDYVREQMQKYVFDSVYTFESRFFDDSNSNNPGSTSYRLSNKTEYPLKRLLGEYVETFQKIEGLAPVVAVLKDVIGKTDFENYLDKLRLGDEVFSNNKKDAQIIADRNQYGEGFITYLTKLADAVERELTQGKPVLKPLILELAQQILDEESDDAMRVSQDRIEIKKTWTDFTNAVVAGVSANTAGSAISFDESDIIEFRRFERKLIDEAASKLRNIDEEWSDGVGFAFDANERGQKVGRRAEIILKRTSVDQVKIKINVQGGISSEFVVSVDKKIFDSAMGTAEDLVRNVRNFMKSIEYRKGQSTVTAYADTRGNVAFGALNGLFMSDAVLEDINKKNYFMAEVVRNPNNPKVYGLSLLLGTDYDWRAVVSLIETVNQINRSLNPGIDEGEFLIHVYDVLVKYLSDRSLDFTGESNLINSLNTLEKKDNELFKSSLDEVGIKRIEGMIYAGVEKEMDRFEQEIQRALDEELQRVSEMEAERPEKIVSTVTKPKFISVVGMADFRGNVMFIGEPRNNELFRDFDYDNWYFFHLKVSTETKAVQLNRIEKLGETEVSPGLVNLLAAEERYNRGILTSVKVTRQAVGVEQDDDGLKQDIDSSDSQASAAMNAEAVKNLLEAVIDNRGISQNPIELKLFGGAKIFLNSEELDKQEKEFYKRMLELLEGGVLKNGTSEVDLFLRMPDLNNGTLIYGLMAIGQKLGVWELTENDDDVPGGIDGSVAIINIKEDKIRSGADGAMKPEIETMIGKYIGEFIYANPLGRIIEVNDAFLVSMRMEGGLREIDNKELRAAVNAEFQRRSEKEKSSKMTIVRSVAYVAESTWQIIDAPDAAMAMESKKFLFELSDFNSFTHSGDVDSKIGRNLLNAEQKEKVLRMIDREILPQAQVIGDDEMIKYIGSVMSGEFDNFFRQDEEWYLSALGTAGVKERKVSLATDLLDQANEGNDAWLILKEVLIHELNHMIDYEYGRLPKEMFNGSHTIIVERSAIIRTSAYFDGFILTNNDGTLAFEAFYQYSTDKMRAITVSGLGFNVRKEDYREPPAVQAGGTRYQYYDQLARQKSDDEAMAAPGGIDFNSENLKMNVKKSGDGVQFSPITDESIQDLNINGLIPVIINVTPATNLPLLLGIAPEQKEEGLAKSG